MEDKQIIYNCPHISLTDWGTYACKLYNPRDKNCLVKGGNCVSNISCPYKQFKRKEQECEELKEKVKKYGEINEQETKDYAELKAENDELRMKNRILETECNEMRDVCNEFEQYYELLMKGHSKLSKTLTEIKEIAEAHKKDESVWNPYRQLDKILQKISECEGKDELTK